MHANQITDVIIKASIEIHRRLGPGLLESVYREVLAYELRKVGFHVHTEKAVPLVWDDLKLDLGFRADLVVNDTVIVESKSVESVHPVHKKQLLTYLRVADKRVGLLINFNEELLKKGITRVVNKLPEE